jgi:tRNA U34 5-methylaminomethyl-2-thiouridine-forming methyltransferase MnmC
MMQPTDSQDNFRLMPCQDGSLTIHSALHDQCFHSSAGALLESQYIYLELGLKAYLASEASTMKTNDDASVKTLDDSSAKAHDSSVEAIDSSMKTLAPKQKISVLEIGFGSGINALLCALEFLQQRSLSNEKTASDAQALQMPEQFEFESIELYPIPEEIWSQLDYASLLANEHFSREEIQAIFEKIHRAPWNERCEILPGFFLHKRHEDILTFEPAAQYQVVFFDAFSPDCQPMLWSKEVFSKIKSAMLPGAFMTTYSSKGFVKQNLRELGFDVHRKPGPGQKRHVLQIRL